MIDPIEDEEFDEIVEHYSTMLKVVEGELKVVGMPMVNGPVSATMKNLLAEATNLPYDGHNPRYVGLTKGQAIIIDLVDQASLGDPLARKEVLDRVLGKPVQNINSLTVKGTIEEFLDQLPERKDMVDVTPPKPHSEVDDL